MKYMHYVYILKSPQHNQIYTGSSSNLKKRLQEHNQGKSIHTNKFRPWKLSAYIAFETKLKARSFESYLKTGSGIAFQRKHL